MPTAILDIIIDCEDPERVASFWSEVLSRPIDGRKGPYVWLTRADGIGLGFQRVTEATQGKNRIHVDLSTADLRSEIDRIEALGGRRVAGYETGGFLVMADPEGNVFCLLPEQPFDVDDRGRASYLDDLAV